MTPEGKLKHAICSYIAEHINDVVFWYQPSQGTFDPVTKTYRELSTFEIPGKGKSDVIFFIKKCPIAFWAEFKTASGQQSDDQLAFETMVKTKLNSQYRVIRNLNDMTNFIESARKEANNYALFKKENCQKTS